MTETVLDEIRITVETDPDEGGRHWETMSLRQAIVSNNHRTIYVWFLHMLFSYAVNWFPGQILTERHVINMLRVLARLEIAPDAV